MIRVYLVNDGFRWCLIGANGERLYYGDTTVYATDHEASSAGCSWRKRFWTFSQERERFPGSF